MKDRKRKTFAQVFWKKWLWILGISCVVYFVVISAIAQREKDIVKTDFYAGWSQLVNNLNKDEKLLEQGLPNNQRMRAAMYAETHGITTLMYEADTKEIIAGCEEQIFMLQRGEEGEPATVYTYYTSEIPGWDEHRAKLELYKKNLTLYYETVDMPYLYTNGTDAIPGPLTVTVSASGLYEMEIEGSVDVPGPTELFVSEFGEPQNIPEGYEKVEVTEDTFLEPLICGYSATNPWLYRHPSANWSYEYLMNSYERDYNQEGKVFSNEAESYFKVVLEAGNYVTVEDSRVVKIRSVCCYDVLDAWGVAFLIFAVVLLVVGLLLALILAKLSHTKLKAQYSIEDYRKNLMNTMAHDLKSPLMSISGYAENLENNMAPGKQEHYARAIQDNVKYMNQVIESVLELSKTEKSGIVLNQENINLKLLLEDAQQKYNLQIKEKNLVIEVEGEISVKADKNLMLQVMDNLLGNAVKYATPGSVVNVTMGSGKLQMSNPCSEDLSVVVNTLCEPFVVGRKSRSGKQGSGLGLAIVKNICELHGYRLQVECRDSCFIVRITNL